MFKKKQNKKIVIQIPDPLDIRIPELQYSRYELVTIDDSFIYENEELTGNIFYDLFIIYNNKDDHNVTKFLNEPFEENLLRIKNNSDIRLYKTNTGYRIYNGRHRIIYLKYTFEKDKNYYPKEIREIWREQFKIPVRVEYELDRNYRELLLNIKSTFPKVRFYKVDPSNDLPVIFICMNKTTYLINNYEELKDFMSNMDKYIYLKRTNDNNINYDELIINLYNLLGIKLYDLTIIDIINYIKQTNIVDINSINMHKLYNCINILFDYITRLVITNKSIDNLNLHEILYSSEYRSGLKIKYIIDKTEIKPNSIEELLSLIRQYPSFDELSDNEIIEHLKVIDYFTNNNTITLK